MTDKTGDVVDEWRLHLDGDTVVTVSLESAVERATLPSLHDPRSTAEMLLLLTAWESGELPEGAMLTLRNATAHRPGQRLGGDRHEELFVPLRRVVVAGFREVARAREGRL